MAFESFLSVPLLSSVRSVSWLPWVSAALAAVIGSRCIYLLNFHPAAKFPGPRLAAVSHIYLVYYWMKGRYPWAVEELHKKYGPVFRIAPNEVIFSTPQAGNDIYTPAVKQHETWRKTDLMDFGAGDLGFVWENDPVKRREVARKVMPAFSNKALRAKEPIVHKYLDQFIEKMKLRGNTPQGIEMRQWTFWLALDMSADLAYSREMHHLRDEKDSEFMTTMLGTSFYGTIVQLSRKVPILKPFAIFFVPLKVITLIPKFLKMNRDAVQARVDTRDKTTHPDFVDYMLPVEAPPPRTEKEKVHLEQVAMQLFIAGFDPIRLVYYGSIFYLLRTPHAYKALVEEIRSSFQSYDEITGDSTARLKYLQACLQESLRVFPLNSTGMPRESPGGTVDGVFIPEGVVCQVSLFTMARSSEYFHDPASYHPERWLPEYHPLYEEKFSNDALKDYFPFGLGPRACTGREIAWSQTRLFLAKLLYTFDLEMIKGQDKMFEKDFTVHVMWDIPDMWVRLKPRK
ncbi:isotrichodermin C-15 hydroxylase [Stachybotrys elegans]|uniref:Isotrichodermin C-15 hydroxylase n=1 Tax=Stachybotrys elegans TaxID=80388 RepID=A0A8K0T0B4_9HYPO|nr:isotrichodermin C-15 hydroxylase [Stachybotrys elegans]